ncbi:MULTISPECIES: hypothetical protein [unclassified Meiothermus]|uniref:HD domain-containing protein n=1 Tax=unclassified Meiothermus TaxID=370471 RepID=UPI000D7C80F3|nr:MULTISPECIES: hypothetical protein [unclassified Meiothermus]PZA06597.1 hypothetical protein DNA98_12445 [Meiothermus sp. Pnk-1]RYM37700.1 hypothetical protein EWH23_05745 [Meiothermus sp. PNK-Is4]
MRIRNKLAWRWRRLMDALGLAKGTAGGVFEDLCRRYSEIHRAYHNLSHLEVLFSLLEGYAIPERSAVELAGWFHDAVYDPARTDNEKRSAELAQTQLNALGLEEALGERVGGLILATQTHQAPDEAAAWLLDADLAVLGFPPGAYAAYARAIRLEYAWMPEERYQEGRARILMGFLERPYIYHTAPFRQRFEARARQNLRKEVLDLRKSGVREAAP